MTALLPRSFATRPAPQVRRLADALMSEALADLGVAAEAAPSSEVAGVSEEVLDAQSPPGTLLADLTRELELVRSRQHVDNRVRLTLGV